MSQTESQIQKGILEVLKQRGILAMRINSGKVKVRGGFYQGAPSGTPDILLIIPDAGHGWLCGLEVKTTTGKQKPSQELWERVWGKGGAGYQVVRSVGEAMAAVDQWKSEARA